MDEKETPTENRITTALEGHLSKIRIRCGAAAPLAANGGGFVGCQEDRGHFPETAHRTIIVWK